MAEVDGKLRLANDGDILDLRRKDDPTKNFKIGINADGDLTKSRLFLQFANLVAPSQAVQVGQFDLAFVIPAVMAGHDIVRVEAQVITAGGGAGNTTVQVRRVRGITAAAVLSTPAQIEPGDKKSTDAATQPVIDTANDDLQTDDLLEIQVPAVSSTAPFGLSVSIATQEP